MVEAGHNLTTLLNSRESTILHDASYKRSAAVVSYVMSLPQVGRELARFRDRDGVVPIHLACIPADRIR